jgi:hypothetical protein
LLSYECPQKALKNLQDVCSIYRATANPAEVIITESALGRGIMGVIDGAKPRGIGGPDEVVSRRDFLRNLSTTVDKVVTRHVFLPVRITVSFISRKRITDYVTTTPVS